MSGMIKKCITCFLLLLVIFPLLVYSQTNKEENTIAVWLFDEQQGLYPSKVLNDVGPRTYPLVLGRAGYIVEGKFGNALEIREPLEIVFPDEDVREKFGVDEYEIPEGRTVEPMNWQNAEFGAFMTKGESHLRTQIGFPHATRTGLNLGSVFDWTVEFWYKPTRETNDDGVVFEIGHGPRGENDKVTRLYTNANNQSFTFFNQPSGIALTISSNADALNPLSDKWSHFAFVYSSDEEQLYHYVNGVLQDLPAKAKFIALDPGIEDYFVVGTDGMWQRPLPGKLDELRFSFGKVYENEFTPPGSFSEKYLGVWPEYTYIKGEPLLFTPERLNEPVVELGERKYLFIDDAIVDQMENISFVLNPPKIDREIMRLKCVDELDGNWERFRKHLSIVEDENGLIRLYSAVDDEYLAVWVSRDGINFEAPDLGVEHEGKTNIVLPEPVGTGTVFIDPNAPPEHRWKYITGYHRSGVYLYTSPDGWSFTRYKQSLLPFRAATQMDVIYDDQRQQYIGYWRSGFARTPGGYTQREFVMSKHPSLKPPLLFTPVSGEEQRRVAQERRLSHEIPWFLDNGPLTPGKFGIEFPTVFGPDDDIDYRSAGVYNPKSVKYPWAPDTYLAFPVFYFHYYEGYPGRQVLSFTRGGGPTETQFSASRDGINWKRYPRPAYVGIGRYDDLEVIQNYIAPGLVKRGDEIWQYVFVDNDYHTAAHERTRKRRIYRLIQRFDGFVSADAPYEKYGTIITRPLRFEGNRLVLNIDTDAHGYALVGLLDEAGNPIPGFAVEESVLINGDHIAIEAEWIKRGIERFRENIRDFDGTVDDVEVSGDVSSLEGSTVRVKIRLRGAKLYSMQFKNE